MGFLAYRIGEEKKNGFEKLATYYAERAKVGLV